MQILNIIFFLFITIVAIQVIYYVVFSVFAFSKTKRNKTTSTPISVIICAKNEAENIKKFLPLIIEQNYPTFEIVLINDASSDDTLEFFEALAKKHNTIKVVDVVNNEAFWGNKKYALTLGIKAAKYNHLLFTDADCKPISKNWISTMSSNFTDKKSIILGYGSYQKKGHNLLNKLIRFETLLTAIQYFSYAKIGSPFMGVGRNLAYTKNDFYSTNGFIKHIKIRSGDDDLFINEVATKQNTTICFSEESFTVSTPKTTFKTWFKQKRRHVSTANLYKTKHKLALGLFYVSQVLFYILPILLLSFLYQWEIVLGLIGLRLVFQYFVFGFSASKLKEKDVLYLLPLLEIGLILAQFSIFITNKISKPKHWK
jgi:glycosyltransferase involved in cell wall biosynthesis